MFGGDCCNPMPCRNIPKTVTMNGKQVNMIASAGTRLRTVNKTISWTERSVQLIVAQRDREILCQTDVWRDEQDKSEAGYRWAATSQAPKHLSLHRSRSAV